MKLFVNLLDVNQLDMDISSGKVPDEWQRRFIAAGAQGRIPLDTYKLDDGREVLNVAGMDVEKLQHPQGKAVSQQAVVHACNDLDELEKFLETSAKNDRRQIQKNVLRLSESDIGG
jgi:hypothetical protein